MTTEPALDAIDYRLLADLQADAGLSNQALAERNHISPATCLRRVRRLEAAGLIERRVAILAPDKLGDTVTAILEVTLEVQVAEALAAFEARAVAEAGVQQCYRTGSGPDFVLIVVVANMDAYHALAHRLLTSAARVRNVRTFFAVKRAKFGVAIPLGKPAMDAGRG